MTIVLLHLKNSRLGVLGKILINSVCLNLSRNLNSLVSVSCLQESFESVGGLGEEDHLGGCLHLRGGGGLGGGPPAEQTLPHRILVGLESPPGGLGGGRVLLLGSGSSLLELDTHNLKGGIEN